MAQPRSQRYPQILLRMIANLVTNTELSDVSDSSAVKGILAASAREDDEQYYRIHQIQKLFSIDTAEGDDLDERAKDVLPSELSRNSAAFAIGSVVFSRPAANAGDPAVAIPIGTVVKTADGNSYTTTAAGTIDPANSPLVDGHITGQDSGSISVIADAAGSAGNVATGTVTKFGAKPTGVTEVTNLAPFTQGADRETDDSFRERIKDFVRSLPRSTPHALKSAAAGVVDPVSGKATQFASVFEDPLTPGLVKIYIDDGAGTAGPTSTNTETIFITEDGQKLVPLAKNAILESFPFSVELNTTPQILGVDYVVNYGPGELYFINSLSSGDVVDVVSAYTHYIDLVAEVQKVIDGDSGDRSNYPGYRAAGTDVRVLPPTVRAVIVQAALTVASGYDKTTVAASAEDAVIEYINNTGIGGDIIRAEIIERIMGIPGASNVTLTSPATDVSIDSAEIARTDSSNVSIT